MLDVSLKRNLLRYAKMMAPVDTGNLRHNAIKGRGFNTPDRFTILYSGSDADYVKYLQDYVMAGGSRDKKNVHYKFIDKTALGMKGLLERHFNQGKHMRTMPSYAREKRADTIERSFRHLSSLSRSAGLDEQKLKREVN